MKKLLEKTLLQISIISGPKRSCHLKEIQDLEKVDIKDKLRNRIKSAQPQENTKVRLPINDRKVEHEL